MRKCDHGVYWPDGDPVALSCQACNPSGTGVGATPVLPRSSGDPLSNDRTDKMETCGHCGCVRTYHSNLCMGCGQPFPLDLSRGRLQGTANAHAAGTCPKCGSAVHFDAKKKSKWICADCDTEYTAPKRKDEHAD